MAKKAVKTEEKTFISYSAAQVLAQMVRSLKVSTFNDYERVKSVIETSNKVSEEWQGVVSADLEKLGIQELTQDHPKYRETIVKFNQPSTIEVKEFQLFSKEELHASLDGISLSFDERDLMERALVKV